jgi:hypothetical protein
MLLIRIPYHETNPSCLSFLACSNQTDKTHGLSGKHPNMLRLDSPNAYNQLMVVGR